MQVMLESTLNIKKQLPSMFKLNFSKGMLPERILGF